MSVLISMDGPEGGFKKLDLSAAGTESLILIDNAITLLQIYLFFAHRALKKSYLLHIQALDNENDFMTSHII